MFGFQKWNIFSKDVGAEEFAKIKGILKGVAERGSYLVERGKCVVNVARSCTICRCKKTCRHSTLFFEETLSVEVVGRDVFRDGLGEKIVAGIAGFEPFAQRGGCHILVDALQQVDARHLMGGEVER
jgi:hypothetical protein